MFGFFVDQCILRPELIKGAPIRSHIPEVMVLKAGLERLVFPILANSSILANLEVSSIAFLETCGLLNVNRYQKKKKSP